MMTRQNPLTLITPVSTELLIPLTARLLQIRQEIETGTRQPFEDLDTIHYARWIILHPKDIDYTYPSSPGVRLVFSSDFDGDIQSHLSQLAEKCPAFIDQIYSCCEGYPDPDTRTFTSRLEYLSRWQVASTAFFAGAPGRSLNQIRLESGLRNYIWKFLQGNKWSNQTSSQVFQAIQREISSHPEFQWATKKIKTPKLNLLGLAILGLVMLIMLPVILPWILLIRFFHESKDPPLGLLPSQVDESHLRELEEYEDLHNQNQFTQILVMKPGRVRLITLLSMMIFAKVLIRNLFVHGKLMGIPTIHFARWVMIDNLKVMVFFSNFDGSWQQYLGDFIDKSGWGLTGIWSNTVKFPKTRFLFWGGAYDEEHFLAWSRYYQIPTQVWYCAYPHLSIKNIINNSAIRLGLGKQLNERQAQAFLNRF